ncbi:DUF2231 domain-containing protein [Limibacter armeniacum]|uniref:DUF2231 domain-containing protein n=1 Tax=Limibacter armeniacum TaxID=466084 RepID=UPI002FE69775
MNIALFLGRFHPLLVHLPIGFLVLAFLMELLYYFKPDRFGYLNKAISFSLLSGVFGSMASVGAGLMLEQGGGYGNEALAWHKWFGIGVTILSLVYWGLRVGVFLKNKVESILISSVIILMLSLTGHLGGNLTHGEEYLIQYAPEVVKKLAGDTSDSGQILSLPDSPDSVQVFTHLLQPVFQQKCVSCHNPAKAKGKLNLTSYQGLMAGGEHGQVVLAEQPYKSPLFVRTTYPHGHVKFMPPSGEPLTFTEQEILAWWIRNGADSAMTLTEGKASASLAALLMRDYGLDVSPKPFYEQVKVAPIPKGIRTELVKSGWMLRDLAANSPLVDVKLKIKKLEAEQLAQLSNIKQQVTWLNLSENQLKDDMLTTVSQFENLTYLKICNNPITDEGLTSLKSLKHLEVLNLYGTAVTSKSFEVLQKLPTLKRVYLWNTNITDQEIEQLKQMLPDLEVII